MAKVEKEEFNKLKEEENFVKSCSNDYEELMEPHYDTATSTTDFERCHQKMKAEIIAKLPQKWRTKMGTSQMPPSIATKVTQKIDQTFLQLSKHFQNTKARQETVGGEKQSKDECLKYYNDEMDKFMSNNRTAGLKDVIVAHTQASMAAMKKAKEVHKVSAATVTDLKGEIEKCFQIFKSQTKMSEKAKQDPAIGIDLGTTNCCVMVYYNGKVDLVPNALQGNSKTTPSYVAYQQDGSDTFGQVAKEEAYRYPETTIYDAKRMIGRKWTDQELQNDRRHWPFEVVDEAGQPKVKTWGQTKFPHEISARLLAQLRLMADEHLNLPVGSVRKAVITVPAYFTEPQRRATSEAAEIAGLDVLNILSEPTAAAVAYSWERRDKSQKRKALIYDLGGGTFDVSVAIVESTNVEILAVDGDCHLGGQDFDQLLMTYCMEEFRKKEGVDLLAGKDGPDKKTRDAVKSAVARLKFQCEKAKEKLSSTQKTTVNVDGIHQNKNLSVDVTKEKLEALVTPLVRKTLQIVDRALGMATAKGVKDKGDIDDVILVGGSTRFPLVAKLLSQHFNNKQLCKHINPDEAVAYGAAVQAAILNQTETVKKVKVQDVTPMTLGVGLHMDKYCKLIPRNSKIPCEESSNIVTVEDNQTAIHFPVYQGEKDIASENKYLGEFVVRGLPPKPAKQEKVTVTMKIDVNGLLHVKGVSVTTGSSEGITITSDKLVMDENTISKLKVEVDRSANRHVSEQ